MFSGLSLQKSGILWDYRCISSLIMLHISVCKLIRGRLSSNIDWFYRFFPVIIVRWASQILQCFHVWVVPFTRDRGEVILLIIFIICFGNFGPKFCFLDNCECWIIIKMWQGRFKLIFLPQFIYFSAIWSNFWANRLPAPYILTLDVLWKLS